MEWVKTTAKTLPEAIDLALDNLGVDESEAEIVVLEEPRPGLFGRMRGTARVEARVKPKPIRPKNDRNRNRRSRSDDKRNRSRNRSKGGRGGRQGGERGGTDSGSERGTDRNDDQAASAGARGGRGGQGDRGGRGGRGDGGQQGEGRSRSRNRRRRGSGDGQETGAEVEQQRGDGRDRAAADQGRGRQRSSGGGEAKASEGASVEEVATHLRTFLTELNEAFGFDSDVTIDDSEEGTLLGRIEGRHGLLVGPKGRTLDAVQELARISCQRTAPSNVRIKVDVGGYREQRSAALAEFAERAAQRAASEGVEVALEPMSPADRKSVHDALNDDDRVETRSVGTEPRRRVVVVPLEVDDDTADEDAVDDADAAAVDSVPAEANGAGPAGDDELTEIEDAAATGADDDE